MDSEISELENNSAGSLSQLNWSHYISLIYKFFRDSGLSGKFDNLSLFNFLGKL